MTVGMAFGPLGLIVLTQIDTGSSYAWCWPATCCSGSRSGSSTRRCRLRRWQRCPPRRSASPRAFWRWTGSWQDRGLAVTGAVFHALRGSDGSFADAVAGSTWILVVLCVSEAAHLGLRARLGAARTGPGASPTDHRPGIPPLQRYQRFDLGEQSLDNRLPDLSTMDYPDRIAERNLPS